MYTGNAIKIPAHNHKLSYVNSAGWICDACSRTSEELQESHSYNCSKCDFNLCIGCTEPLDTGKHPHPLQVTDTTTIYPNGDWACDNCGTTSVIQGTTLSWHCKELCYFDFCYGCTKDHFQDWESFHRDDPEKPYNCSRPSCGSYMEDTEFEVEKVQMKVQNVTDGFNTWKSFMGSRKELLIKLVNSTGERLFAPGTPQNGEASVATVFISYQWNIQDKVLKLKKKLEANNIICWMDTSNMAGGDELKKEIDKGIRGCKLMVSCVTRAYSQSKACQQEVALADLLKKPILPILLESITWPPEGAMAMTFAPLIYVDCQRGLNTKNLHKVFTIVQSKV